PLPRPCWETTTCVSTAPRGSPPRWRRTCLPERVWHPIVADRMLSCGHGIGSGVAPHRLGEVRVAPVHLAEPRLPLCPRASFRALPRSHRATHRRYRGSVADVRPHHSRRGDQGDHSL